MTMCVTLNGGHGDGVTPIVSPGGGRPASFMLMGVGLLSFLLVML